MNDRLGVHILVADDDLDDCFLTEQAFRDASFKNSLHFVHDGEQLMNYLRREPPYDDSDKYPFPGLILLDLNMPGLSGLEVLQILSQDLPDCAVIVLTVSEEGDELAQALRSGARGYLVKNIDAEVLVDGIRKAVEGEPVIDQGMTAKLVEQFRNPAPVAGGADTQRSKLTAREMQVTQLLARGASNKAIARELDVSESTVKIHVQNILKKLNLNSRVQIAVYVVEHGLGPQ